MIDPRISLAVQQASVAPAIDLFRQIRKQRRDEEIQDQLLPAQLQLQQQKLQAGEQRLQQGELEQQRLRGLIQTEQDAMDMKSLGYFATQNKDLLERASTGDKDASNDLFRLMLDRKYQLQEQGRSTQQTDEALQAIGADRTPDVANALLRTPQLTGLTQSPTAGQQELAYKAKVMEGVEFDELGQVKNPELLTPEQRIVAGDIGSVARASLSADERIGLTPGLTETVAKSKAKITSEIKKAEKLATERGDAFTDLARLRAAMPTLEQNMAKLKDLAAIATSTLGGRVWDFAVKETGFGATKGADAREQFIGIVNNQILPLLKPTFGGNTSDQELRGLEKTMADPDDSPTTKINKLNNFIELKVGEIESKGRLVEEFEAEAQNQFEGFEILGVRD